MIKREDVIIGEVYYGKSTNNRYLDKIDLCGTQRKGFLDVKDNGFSKCKGTLLKNYIRIATPEEKRHLEACIAAGKYVECPKELTYEIY